MVLGIGKAHRRWRFYVNVISPIADIIEKLWKEGTLFSKANLGSRKLRMVLIAQIVGTSIAGIGAWLGLDNDHLKMVLDFLSTTLFAGVGGNLFEHVTDTIKTVRAKKEEVEPT